MSKTPTEEMNQRSTVRLLVYFRQLNMGTWDCFFKFLVPLRCNEPCLRALYADHLNLLQLLFAYFI